MRHHVLLLFFIVSFFSQAFADELAITIDDLPIHGADQKVYTRQQLAELLLMTFQKHKLPPVYGFINGVHVASKPATAEILNTWTAGGNPLGNHTWSHLDLRKSALQTYLDEIDRNDELLKKYSRGMDYKVFRHPFLLEGETYAKRDGIRAHLAKNGYKIAEVTVDYWDFRWNKPVARCLNKRDSKGLEELRKLYVESAINELEFSRALSQNLFGRDIKQILLAHIGVATALFLDDALTAYERMQTKFIDLHDAMSDPLYDVDTKVLSSSGPNFLDQMVKVKKARYPAHKELPLKKIDNMCL